MVKVCALISASGGVIERLRLGTVYDFGNLDLSLGSRCSVMALIAWILLAIMSSCAQFPAEAAATMSSDCCEEYQQG